MKGVFLDTDSLHRGDLNLDGLCSSLSELRFYPDTEPSMLASHVGDAEVVILNKVKIEARFLESMPGVKLICIAATGTNNVDLEAATRQGIVVTNIRGYANHSVAQHVFALILSLYRNLNQYREALERGEWHRSNTFSLLDYPIEDLQDKRLGIIGYGELGKSVAVLARCMGMEVYVSKYHATHKGETFLALPDLVSSSDIISLHCPLTETTRNLIGKEQLRCMKKTALLINTARGGIVNEAALAQALEEKWIAGAGIDVLEVEPPDGSSPLGRNIPNLLLTPHIAWASRGARQSIVEQLALIIKSYLSGKVINQVNG